MPQYGGKSALKMIASKLDSDPNNKRLSEVKHVDPNGYQSESTEEDFLWHLVRWAADYDMAAEKARVNLSTHRYTDNSKTYWCVELWSESDNANPIHIFYLYF